MALTGKNKEEHAFVSYSHADKKAVEQIVNAVSKQGFRLWMDRISIQPGSEWRDAIAESILDSECVLAFLSKNYMNSDNCRVEIGYALSKKKKIVCVMLMDDVDFSKSRGLEMYLSHNQAIMRSACPQLSDMVYEIARALPPGILDETKVPVMPAKKTAFVNAAGSKGRPGNGVPGSVNTGDGNTGSVNTGNGNVGNGNAGNENTGDGNTGSGNNSGGINGSGNNSDGINGGGNADNENSGSQNSGSELLFDDDGERGLTVAEVERIRKRKELIKKIKRYGLIAGCILALFVVYKIVHAVSGALYRIDVTKYLADPVFVGMEGEGRIGETLHLDEEALDKAVAKGLKYRKKDSELPELDGEDLAAWIAISAEPVEGLKNGDTVKVSFEYDAKKFKESYGLRIKGKSKSIKVEGLGEFAVLDPFRGVTVTLEGTAPSAKAVVNYPADNPTSGSYYSLTVNGEDRAKNIAIGDKVTLVLTDSGADNWKSQGLTPARKEVTFTVTKENTPYYLPDVSDLSTEGFSAIVSEAGNIVAAETAGWKGSVEIEEDTAYLMLPKEDYLQDYRPCVTFLYKAIQTNGEEINEYYLTVTTSALWIEPGTQPVFELEKIDPPSGISAGKNAEGSKESGKEAAGDASSAEGEDGNTVQIEGVASLRYSLKDFSGASRYDSREKAVNDRITAYVDRYQAIELK